MINKLLCFMFGHVFEEDITTRKYFDVVVGGMLCQVVIVNKCIHCGERKP